MPKRKNRRARQQSKAPQQGRAQRGQKAVGAASLFDRKPAESREKVEQANKSKALLETGLEKKEVEKAQAEAEQPELLQRLRRDYNLRHLRDQIAVKVVDSQWRADTLGWEETTPSQLGRLRNAVLRPVKEDNQWKEGLSEFLAQLDFEKWSKDTGKRDILRSNLNRLADPDSFWQAAGITPPETPPEVEPHFYWRAALTTLLLGALRAHSRERERERANPGADS